MLYYKMRKCSKAATQPSEEAAVCGHAKEPFATDVRSYACLWAAILHLQ